jgi:large subunit ribosomal protein L2
MKKLINLINYKLFKQFNFKGGRNHLGHITVRHRGCLVKRKNIIIDTKRAIFNLNSIVLMLRPAPKISGFVGLIMYENGLFSYILAPAGLSVGQVISSKIFRSLTIGNFVPLYQIPYGILVCNVEIKLGYGGQYSKSAGSFSKLLTRYPNKYNKLIIQLKSGEQYLINRKCGATLGSVSNINYWLKNFKKASQSRKLGFRPTVRGIAMNPVDHPHGGRTNGGCPSVSPTGLLTKGKKTRKKKIINNIIFKRKC